MLDLAAQANGFNSRFWATYQQWQQLGDQVKIRPDSVKSGHWGTNIVFFRQVKKTNVDAAGDEKITSFPLMKFYTVFNLDQVEGEKLDHLRPSGKPTDDVPDFDEAEKVIAATGAEIKYGGNRAVYTRPVGQFPNHSGGDFIRMPSRHQFDFSTSSMPPYFMNVFIGVRSDLAGKAVTLSVN